MDTDIDSIDEDNFPLALNNASDNDNLKQHSNVEAETVNAAQKSLLNHDLLLNSGSADIGDEITEALNRRKSRPLPEPANKVKTFNPVTAEISSTSFFDNLSNDTEFKRNSLKLDLAENIEYPPFEFRFDENNFNNDTSFFENQSNCNKMIFNDFSKDPFSLDYIRPDENTFNDNFDPFTEGIEWEFDEFKCNRQFSERKNSSTNPFKSSRDNIICGSLNKQVRSNDAECESESGSFDSKWDAVFSTDGSKTNNDTEECSWPNQQSKIKATKSMFQISASNNNHEENSKLNPFDDNLNSIEDVANFRKSVEDFRQSIIRNSSIEFDNNKFDHFDSNFSNTSSYMKNNPKNTKSYKNLSQRKKLKSKLSKFSFSLSNLSDMNPPNSMKTTNNESHYDISHKSTSSDEEFCDFRQSFDSRKYKKQNSLKKSLSDVRTEMEYKTLQLLLG